MGYRIEKGRLYQKGGVGIFGYKKFEDTFAPTLDEAKEKFKEYAGILPKWLEKVRSTEYLQVEDEIKEGNEYKGLIVSIEGAENTMLVGEAMKEVN